MGQPASEEQPASDEEQPASDEQPASEEEEPELEPNQQQIKEQEQEVQQEEEALTQQAEVMHKVGKAEEAQAEAKIAWAVAIKTDGDTETAQAAYEIASIGAVAAKLEQLPPKQVQRVEAVVDQIVRGEENAKLARTDSEGDVDPSSSLPNAPPSADAQNSNVAAVSTQLENQEREAKEALAKAKAAFDSSMAHAQESKLVDPPSIQP